MATTDAPDATTVATDATTVATDATTVATDATTVATDATTVATDATTIKVLVNGEETELHAGTTVAGLLETLGLRSRRVAVELNRDVLSRELWQDTTIREHDRIEIVQFVGGG